MRITIRTFGVIVLDAVAVFQCFGQIALQSTLKLFLEEVMHIERATAYVNLWICLYLLAGICGGLTADYIGRRGNYIISLVGSLIWCCGGLVLVLPEYPPLDIPTLFFGLGLSAIGYGFIFPTQICFVGSQYDPNTEADYAATAVAYWYVANNIGDMTGESLGPILRQTFGGEVCLFAIAMATAVGSLLFVFGSPLYRNALLSSRDQPERTAPYTDPTTSTPSVPRNADERSALLNNETTDVVRPQIPLNKLQMFLIVVPIPVFYAINYMQNTTLVDQGLLLNRAIFGWEVPPDLMASVQDLFLLVVIPFFDSVLFPRVALLRDPTSDHDEQRAKERQQKRSNRDEKASADDNDVDNDDDGDNEGSKRHVKLIDASQEDASLSTSRHLLARIAIGVCCSALAMLSCALVSVFLVVDVTSIGVQLPALFLFAVAEALVAVSGLQLIVGEAGRRGFTKTTTTTAVWLAFGSIGAILGAAADALQLQASLQFVIWCLVAALCSVLVVIAFRMTYAKGR